MQYHCALVPGGSFFFTVVTAGRNPFFADQHNIATLRAAFRAVGSKRPFALVGLTRRVKALSFVWERQMTQEQFATLEIQIDAPPLRQDDSGAVRIGKTQVLLELVIRAFEDGATPETIVQRYPSTTLADIYAVIAYYLQHRGLIERYLADRERQAEEVRRRIEAHQDDLSDVRRRLLAQRTP